MRLGSSAPITFDWLDRSPLVVVHGYTGTISNDGGGTTRWTYTCPAGRRALVTSLAMFLRVSTAAAAVDFCRESVVVFDGVNTVNLGMLEVDASAVGNLDRIAYGAGTYLAAADVIWMTTTTIGAIGAAYLIMSGIAILEFSA